jgi:hypothetical protein
MFVDNLLSDVAVFCTADKSPRCTCSIALILFINNLAWEHIEPCCRVCLLLLAVHSGTTKTSQKTLHCSRSYHRIQLWHDFPCSSAFAPAWNSADKLICSAKKDMRRPERNTFSFRHKQKQMKVRKTANVYRTPRATCTAFLARPLVSDPW